MTEQSKPNPKVVGWEITSQCNLTCPHCFSAAAKRPHDEMDTGVCKEVIDSLSRIGTEIIGWTGGEPLLREDLEELIAYAAEKGIKSGITTNGVLLDEKRAISLKKAGNGPIQISLDGSTPERNFKMRRASEEEYHKIIEAFRVCKKHDIKVYLATLLGLETLDDAPEMLKLAIREKVEGVRFCGYTPAGRGKSQKIRERLSFGEELARLHKFIEDVQSDDSVMAFFDPGFGPVPPDYHYHECIAGKETFYIKGNGDIYPCTSLLHKQFKVGNLRQRPLVDIWNDPAISAMADCSREEIHGHCRDCDNLSNCRGACRGITYAHTGDINDSFPVCLYRVARAETGCL